MEIPDRFCSADFIVCFRFFQKVESKGQGCTAGQYADVCISVVCALLYPHARHNLPAVYPEPSVQSDEYGSVRGRVNGPRGLCKANFAERYHDGAVRLFVPHDAKTRRRISPNRIFLLLVSLGIELLQPLINGFRSADITDLITNTIGGMAGYLLYIAFRPVTSWVLARLRK